MPSNRKQVCPQKSQSKATLSVAIGAAWSRVANTIGKGSFADRADFDEVTYKRAVAGPSLPSAEHLLNSLAADPTALDEVMALYGLAVHPSYVAQGTDIELLSRLGHTLAEYIDRMRDGRRCHNDTLAMAVLFRPLIPQLAAIVAEADELRGVR